MLGGLNQRAIFPQITDAGINGKTERADDERDWKKRPSLRPPLDSQCSVMFDFADDFAAALQTNYPEFPDSCPSVKLSSVVNVCQMFVYGSDILLKQLGQ